MNKLNFFTSVKYNNHNKSFSDSLLEKVDNYFKIVRKRFYSKWGVA